MGPANCTRCIALPSNFARASTGMWPPARPATTWGRVDRSRVEQDQVLEGQHFCNAPASTAFTVSSVPLDHRERAVVRDQSALSAARAKRTPAARALTSDARTPAARIRRHERRLRADAQPPAGSASTIRQRQRSGPACKQAAATTTPVLGRGETVVVRSIDPLTPRERTSLSEIIDTTAPARCCCNDAPSMTAASAAPRQGQTTATTRPQYEPAIAAKSQNAQRVTSPVLPSALVRPGSDRLAPWREHRAIEGEGACCRNDSAATSCARLAISCRRPRTRRTGVKESEQGPRRSPSPLGDQSLRAGMPAARRNARTTRRYRRRS